MKAALINLFGKSAVLVILVVVSGPVKAETWNGITPLVSTRADVKRILGDKTDGGFYQHPVGKVRISFGAGDPLSTTCIGRAPTDLVTIITVSLDIALGLRDLGIDRSRFEKIQNTHHPSNYQLANKERGLAYSLTEDDDEVYSIMYWPRASDCDAFLKRGLAVDSHY